MSDTDDKKRPAFQFYPGDWRKDVELRSCSLAARGLWIDLLCVAHECEPYGHLTVNGRPMTPAQMSGQIGVPAAQITRLLEELLANGVARRTEDGAIYSRRMVKDERTRNARAEGGKAGSEHGFKGAEHGSKGGRPKAARGVSEPPSKPPLEPPPSSSSSSSSSEEDPHTPGKRGQDGVHEFPPGFDAFWTAYPRKTDKQAACKAFARLKPDEALLALLLAAVRRHAASEQWTKDRGQFIPHAATWLNRRRWEDQLPGMTDQVDDVFAAAR